MPEIEITPEQAERLSAVQADLAADVVGKYGHVRAQDALEYLLDEYETGADSSEGESRDSGGETSAEADLYAADSTPEDEESTADVEDDTAEREPDASDGATAADGAGSGGDSMLNAMMNLLQEHDDKWGESSGEERYEVELPDGSTEQVRTKDDVRARLFEHYR